MCNIIQLLPSQMPKKDEFFNMCHNNWHSYGLVTKVDGKLDIKKKVPKNGEIDPEEVWQLLRSDIEFERILHVRHNTAGATTLDNAHPFDVYYNPATGKQVVFMHNGTLYQYKSKTVNTMGTVVDDETGPSDSKNFAEQVLSPLIAGSNFGTGLADIHNPFFKTIIREFWTANNRGVLIANDQAPFFFGDWKEWQGDGDFKMKSANTEYFGNVTRGPEFSRREAAKKAAQEEARTSQKSSSVNEIVPISNFRFQAKHRFYQLKESLSKILNDWNVYDRAGAVHLGMATRDELAELYEAKEDCISVMDWVFSDYYKMYDELLEVEAKRDRASKKIAELQNENATLRALLPQEEIKAAA